MENWTLPGVFQFQNTDGGTSLVVQRLRLTFPVQGAQVRSLIAELRFCTLWGENRNTGGMCVGEVDQRIRAGLQPRGGGEESKCIFEILKFF